MIVAVPSPTEVTKPFAETVITFVSDELHVTVAPDMMLSAASFAVTTSVVVSPNEVKFRVVGESVTDAAA